jgi:hypothetical protein
MRKQTTHVRPTAAALAWVALLVAAPAATLASGEVVGQVGDKKITLEEVDARVKVNDPSVFQALYDARRQALNGMIENRLLEVEAAARKTSVEELIKTEIDSKVAPVTDEEVEAWYNENKARVGNRSLASIQTQIKQFLAMQRETEVRKTYFDGLKKKLAVKVRLEPPRADIVLAANDPYKGPKEAPVTIVEYSDFQ